MEIETKNTNWKVGKREEGKLRKPGRRRENKYMKTEINFNYREKDFHLVKSLQQAKVKRWNQDTGTNSIFLGQSKYFNINWRINKWLRRTVFMARKGENSGNI